MSKTEHTPGPRFANGSSVGAEQCKDHGDIATCNLRTGTHIPQSQNNINARLISAGPDLLAACQALPLAKFENEDNLDAAEFVDYCGSFLEAMRLARAAIAKATGATQ